MLAHTLPPSWPQPNPACGREPSALPISKLAFEFDRRKLTMEEVRELIYREGLEYHPTALAAHLSGVGECGEVWVRRCKSSFTGRL